MSKQEFIDILRASLMTELGSALVEENVRYYESYITSQVRFGKSEEQVMAELGNPRLIAKSIVEAVKGRENIGSEYKTAQNDNGGNYYHDAGYRDTGEGSRSGYETSGAGMQRGRIRKIPTWLFVLIVIVLIVVVISLVVTVIWWLAPVILVIWFATFLIRLLKRSS